MTIRRIVSIVGFAYLCGATASVPKFAIADHAKSDKPPVEPVWSPPSSSTLWYDSPAVDAVTEGLPVGNGATCCRIMGGVESDDTQFLSVYHAFRQEMPTVFPKYLKESLPSNSIHIALSEQSGYTNYHRDLDLNQAVAHVSYTVSGIHFSRSYFWSAADRALVIQLSADKKASYSGSITLTGPASDSITATTDTLFGAGKWSAAQSYSSEVRIEHDGGKLITNGHEIDFSKCNSLTLIGASDSILGTPQTPTVADRIASVSLKSANSILNTHIQTYQAQNDLASFSLTGADSDRLALPTDKRRLMAADGSDPNLESLFVQYLQYQRIISGNVLPPGQNMPTLIGDDLSVKIVGVLTSDTTQTNLLFQRTSQIDLDRLIAQGIDQSLVSYGNGDIYLLPSLPAGWKAGYKSGLPAGNDFTVDVTWIEGRLATVLIHSITGKPGTVHYGKISAKVNIKAGKELHLGSFLKPEL